MHFLERGFSFIILTQVKTRKTMQHITMIYVYAVLPQPKGTTFGVHNSYTLETLPVRSIEKNFSDDRNNSLR